MTFQHVASLVRSIMFVYSWLISSLITSTSVFKLQFPLSQRSHLLQPYVIRPCLTIVDFIHGFYVNSSFPAPPIPQVRSQLPERSSSNRNHVVLRVRVTITLKKFLTISHLHHSGTFPKRINASVTFPSFSQTVSGGLHFHEERIM